MAKVSRDSVGVEDKCSPATHPMDNLSLANQNPVDRPSQASAVFLVTVDSAEAIPDHTDHVAGSTWVMASVMALLGTALLIDTRTIPAMLSIQLVLTDRHPRLKLARAAHMIRMETGSQIPTAIPANRNIRGHRRTTVPIRGNIPRRRTTIINRDIRHSNRTTIPGSSSKMGATELLENGGN